MECPFCIGVSGGWAGANDLCLFREDGSSFPNGGEIDSRAVASWPLRFRAGPLAPAAEFAARVLGEADSVTGEKAADTIHGRVVNVDLDVEADGEPGVTDADEPKEEDPGGYACVCTNNLTPIKLTLEPGGLPGKVTLSATAGGSRIRVWQDAGRATEVPLTTGAVWNAGAAIPGTLYVEGVTPSAALRDVALRLEYDENPAGQNNPLFKCADVVRLTILKVEITPASMNATESLDSGTFTCTVTPVGLSPTYQWLTGAANGAWPATAGNSPELDYSAATASSTKVKETRWFAPTPSRRQVIDGTTASYSNNCKVTVGGIECKAQSASVLNVSVNMTGQCTRPTFIDWQSIQVQKVGAVWQVTGQGTFRRTAPAPSVNVPATSQFHSKAMTHENKHVTQWTTEAPWKDLFDADALYTATLSALTSNVSEADLRNQIFTAVLAKFNADNTVANDTVCDREQGAFDAMNAVEPDFLELDEADWKPLYGCP